MDKAEEKFLKEPVQNGSPKGASAYPFAPVAEDEPGTEKALIRMTSGFAEGEAVTAEPAALLSISLTLPSAYFFCLHFFTSF